MPDTTLPPPGTVVNAPQGTDTIGAYSSPSTSPVMNSNVSRSQTNANTQIYNAKVDSLAVTSGTYADGQSKTNPDGSVRADQPTNTGVVVSPDGNAPVKPPTVYVDDNFASTHDMSNPAFKGYVVGTPDGNTPKTDSTDPNAAIDGKYAKMGADYTANAQSQLTQAKTEMDTWKTNNDAIANSLIEGIKATFDSSIATMTEMNRQATARDTATGYGDGAARYAPQLNDSVISDTVQKGIMRINDLKAQEITAVAKAQQAKNNDDIAEFNKYMDQVSKTNSDVTSELTRLANQANADKNQLIQQSQEQRAQQKATMDAANNLAKQYAPSASDALDALPTDAAKKKYLDELAKSKGIDPLTLQGEIDAYKTGKTKDALSAENTRSEIANRAANQKTSQYNAETSRINANTAAGKAAKGTVAEKKDNAFAGINQLLSPGIQSKITAKGGIPYIDSEGYITPEGFKSIVSAAAEDGISRKEILDKYGSQMYIEKGKPSKYGLTAKETATYASANAEPDNASVIDRSMIESFTHLNTDATEKKVDAYKKAGMTDKDIIKLLNSENDKAA